MSFIDDEDKSWEAWVVVAGMALWYGVLYLFIGVVFDVLPRLSLDMIEHQVDVEAIKETVRNIWTQIALLAALLFTVVAAMLISPDIHEGDDDYTGRVGLRTAYVCLSGLATLQFIQAICECMIHLVYTEALNSAGVMRYVLSGGCGNLGGPMISIFLGCFHTVLAMIVYVVVVHGLPAVAFIGLMAVILLIVLVNVIRQASSFSPRRGDAGAKDWLYFESPEDAPRGACCSHKLGKRAEKICQKRALQARQYEESKGLFDTDLSFEKESSKDM